MTSIALIGILLQRISELEEENMFDELTQVKNQKALIRRWSSREKIGVLAIDVIGLGAVNREQGHHEGDTLLKNVAQHLRYIFRNSDTIYRRGGDEFVVITTLTSAFEITAIEKRIYKTGLPVYVGAAVEGGCGSIEDLTKAAFGKVEKMKLEKRNRFH